MHFRGTANPCLWPITRTGLVRLLVALALVLGGWTLLGLGTAAASPLPSESIGVDSQPETVNGKLVPTNLSRASASNVGTVRMELDQQPGSPDAADSFVTLAAEAHLRVAPILGLSTQMNPSQAATAMAGYVTAFAERYGPNGSFWSANPKLPYLPVDTYEIGNEPNIPSQWVQDETHLHWPSDPADYAEVYEASEAALHKVDPSGIALVGGLADSGADGVDLQHDEEWLAAITPSSIVDAVGYHPYAWQGSGNVDSMFSDTEALRAWMNANGMQNAPIQINEIGACASTAPGCPIAFSSSAWGSFAAGFLEWALCTPSLGVSSLTAEYWGAQPSTDSDNILALSSSNGNLTPYGQDYLAEASTLTTQGCPTSAPPPPPPPPPSPASASPVSSVSAVATTTAPKQMQLRLRGVHVHRHRLTVLVGVIPGSGHVTVVAVRRHRRVRLRLIRWHRASTLLAFAATLPAGRWTVGVSCSPAPGYAVPASVGRSIRIM